MATLDSIESRFRLLTTEPPEEVAEMSRAEIKDLLKRLPQEGIKNREGAIKRLQDIFNQYVVPMESMEMERYFIGAIAGLKTPPPPRPKETVLPDG